MNSMDELWNILAAAGSGGLLVQFFNWLRNRKLSKARQGSDIDTAYLDNINILREELIKIQDENRKLYRAIARLDRTVARATSCRHWDDCPIRNELQKSGADDSIHPSKRHPAGRKRIRADTATGRPQRSEDNVSDEDTGCDTGGHRL